MVFVTDGSQSHRDYASLKIRDIVASRRQEAIAACEILGVPAGDLHFLDGSDGQLGELASVERSEMVHRLAGIVASSAAEEICVPHHKDCHPDHEASHALLLDAMDLAGSTADVLEYPIWLLWKRTLLDWTVGELAGAQWLEINLVREQKNRAIDIYASQLPSMPRGFVPQFKGGDEFFWRHHLAGRREVTARQRMAESRGRGVAAAAAVPGNGRNR